MKECHGIAFHDCRRVAWGRELTAILEGLPSGLLIDPAAIDAQLRRRQGGFGRGGRMKIEKDQAQFTAGVRHGCTLGSPIALQIPNLDHKNWQEIMGPFTVGARFR